MKTTVENTAATAAPLMSERQRKTAFVLCLATIVLAVLDQNIVSAATVPIVRDLDPAHGVDLIPWLISAFALASTAVLPLYGKLCDTLGPKRVYLGAIAAFLTGSALCGAAQSMGQLIAFRAIQGIGGGGLMSVTMVVMAHLRAPGEKPGGGKSGSMGGIVAGAGLALGPLVGGLLADHADWRWIFYINLPLGLVVLLLSARVLRLPVRTRGHRVDYLGAALAAAFSTGLLLVTQWGGKQYGWTSPVVLGLIAGCVAALGLFLWRQATAAEPILPLPLFRDRVLRIGFAVQALMGMALTGSMVYVLIYLQVVRGLGATSAGLFLLPMAAGMTGIGLLAGRLVSAGWSQRAFVICGSGSAAVAMLLLATTHTDTSLWLIRAELLLLGVGFGQLIGQLIQLVQATAPAHQLGVATTAVRFFQTLGGALGASLFGTLLARAFADRSPVPGASTSSLPLLRGAERAAALHAFTSATDIVLLSAAGVMALAFVLALRLPRPAKAGQGAATGEDARVDMEMAA